MPNYEKLHKLNMDTANRLTDKNCDIEKEMAKYKKQRNILLGAGAAVTISLGTALVKLKKSKDTAVRHAASFSASVYEFEEEVSMLSDAVNDKNAVINNKNDIINNKNDIILGFRHAIVDKASRIHEINGEVERLSDNMSKKLENIVAVSKEDAQDFIDNFKKVSKMLFQSNKILLDDYDELVSQNKKTEDIGDELDTDE